MENEYEHLQHKKQDVSSTLSMFPPNSNSPESTSSAPPPPYSNPSQYPPASGMPYPQYYSPPNPVMGYPQPYAPPPGGQPYFPQPGVYPGQPSSNYPVPQSQQQQQVVIMNNHPTGVTPVYVARAQSVSMVGAIVLSCFVYWCFGFLFGGIAFILAMVGQSSAAAGDTLGALRLRNASIALSIVGIVIAIIIIVVVASVFGRSRSYYQNYYYCYRYDRYYSSSSSYYYYCR